jgi:F-type H+-transporting ATPase subunit alpha
LKTIRKGERLVEVLKQGQYEPLHVGLQIASIYGVTKGYCDKRDVTQVKEWEKGLHEHLKARYASLLEKFEKSAKLDEVEPDLKKAIEEFDKGFK